MRLREKELAKLNPEAVQAAAKQIHYAATNPLRRIEAPKTKPLPKIRAAPSDVLEFQLRASLAPDFQREYRFDAQRRFRIDFYFPDQRLAVELDGGGWINGRHSRGAGIESDAEKSALIARLPARLMRVTPTQVKDGRALTWILNALTV